MLTITRAKAATSTTSELNLLLKRLFNKLAEDRIDDLECRCCHSSIQTVRAELASPGRF
ncbi:MAG: hypothetical protein WC807_16490 [Hyphomicrobium sp.]|jgi:hypothetical protein